MLGPLFEIYKNIPSRRIVGLNRQFQAPQLGAKLGSSEPLLQNSGPTTSADNNSGGKREGWKAHESLKHFDDNIIGLIESEVCISLVFGFLCSC